VYLSSVLSRRHKIERQSRKYCNKGFDLDISRATIEHDSSSETAMSDWADVPLFALYSQKGK